MQTLTLCEHAVPDLHPVFAELRDRFKRHPAFVCVRYGGELLCLVTLHLPSDGSKAQKLRLNAEISALPSLAASLKQSTGARHVVLLGDFNRNPDTVCFAELVQTHPPALLPGPGVRTNTGAAEHVYDNFFVPRELWPRAAAAIAHHGWMRLGLESDPSRLCSDHYPVLLSLQPPPDACHAEL